MLAVRLVEALLVDREPVLRRHLAGHLEREAERVVELERGLAGDLALSVGLELLRDLLVHRLALVQGRVEALLLRLEIRAARREIRLELRIDVLVLRADDLRELHRESRRNADHAREADRTADETPEDVVRPDVARLHTALRIAEDERRRAHVIRDDAAGLEKFIRRDIRNVRGLWRPRTLTQGRELIYFSHDRGEDLGVVDGRGAAHHADRALDTHARVDVVTTERLELALLVLVVLHEDVVPDLDVLPAMAAGTAIGSALLLAGVDEHLRVGTARTRRPRGTPPVVLARQAEDALLGDAERLPDLDRLLVRRNPLFSLEDGDVQLLRLEAEMLRQELEAPADRLLLEVVVEGPVAEHLEEREVRRVTDLVDVARPDALLHVRQPRPRRMLHRAHQVRDERMHARRGEEDGRIVLRNHRGPGNDLVPLRLEELEVGVTQLVSSQILHKRFRCLGV